MMQVLEKTMRSQLERTVRAARDEADKAARAALEQLGVGEAAPYDHLTDEERELRRKLRLHGRQLGDSLNGGKVQTMDRLIEEVAYEHWHRMLFARFLAENNLLMYPDPDDPVAVTLEECEDLAKDEGAANGWELAARFAARMLPQIFRPDSPVFLLTLPPEYQQKMERLVAELPQEVFTASDSLGWVYQFWQAKKKDEVNASEVKIGARELPAVTQLFTEPYMVSFLLDNALGAWWVKQCSAGSDPLSEKARELLKNAASEEDLRLFFSRPGIPLEYLRFVKTDHSTQATENSCSFDGEHWMPAAGWFAGWPDSLCELKTLDPCCGSGHFLVAAFLMLVPMRMEREGLSAREAVDRVLAENIHGLELDRRCVELAAFALALTAWRYPGAGGYRALPELHLACSGLSVSESKAEWKKIAHDNTKLRVAMEGLYEEFSQAEVLGSLIDPTRRAVAKLVEWDGLAAAVNEALGKTTTDDAREAGVTAQGLAKAAQLLAGKYQWVITNVPYLARGKQGDVLKAFCEKYYPEAKNDLATVFLDRCLELCAHEKNETGEKSGGVVSVVLPQNWLFLTSYKKFREKLLNNETWNLIARLGPGAFETISGEVVKAILITLSRGSLTKESSNNEQDVISSSLCLPWTIKGLDVSEFRTASEKADGLLSAEIKSVEQANQLENPDARVAFDEVQGDLLEKYCLAYIGQRSGDGLRFITFHWEFDSIPKGWDLFGTTVDNTADYSGNTQVFLWENGIGLLAKYQAELARTQYASGGWKQGWQAWGVTGIRVSQMNILPVTIHCKPHFDNNTATIIPQNPIHLPAIWCFCSSPEYNEAVRQIDQSLKVTNATLVKVPFDLDHWTQVAQEKYPNGLPKPYTDDPTQWIFHGHPCDSVIWDETEKWTAHGPVRHDPTVLQVAVARLLGYRWPAELDDTMELADEQREWVKRCDALLPFADEDGIVCIPAVRGEQGAADRLHNLLAAAYGDAWSGDTLAELLKNADHEGKTLETWLREKFFTQHFKLFHHRPFIWHVWDGLRDGFAALVNYHKLDYKNLETLIYTYLGDWIIRQTKDRDTDIDGAQEKLAAAERLKKSLELILEGENPYDIFVRWKPLSKQPIGWNPDLNDGVRLNIRPFLSVPDVGKRGAGVLRDKPNINWNKDRGKDVESAPWFGVFNGDRINDYHLSLDQKRTAQAVKGESI